MNNWDKKLAQEAMKYGFVPSKPDLYKEEVEQVNEDAATILKHLGGDKFIKKTDAWGWSKSIGKNYLDLQLPDKYLNGINRVKITLDASGTYTVEFGRISLGTTGKLRKEEAEQVNEDASVILQQLGGNKFVMMTGAKNLMKSNGGKTLSFRLPKALGGINYVKITLDASDTYTVEFGRVSGTTYTVKKEFANVYADQLQNIFTKTTGLYTKL